MNVNCLNSKPCDIKKKVFSLKPVQKDGLILKIHHTTFQHSLVHKRVIPHVIRFAHASFSKSGLVLACADIEGNIFVIDFRQLKFWLLPKFDSCSTLIFSFVKSDELIIGTDVGTLYFINIHSGSVSAILHDHKYPVKDISFANELCLTSSTQEAIVYNSINYKKEHALTLKSSATLKHVLFMPVTCHVLACFADDFINIWKNKTFESYKQIFPITWRKCSLKCIAFTRNGEIMVLGGHSSFLVIFMLDSWSVNRTMTLPPSIQSVKMMDFIPQTNDGGANRILAVLSSDGILYFFDLTDDSVLHKIQKNSEIISFACSANGTRLACVLHSGEIDIYKVPHLVKVRTNKKDKEMMQETKLKLYLPAQKQLSDVLDLTRLKLILQEFGEYPEMYRNLIWMKILKLPNNKHSYSALVSRVEYITFRNIEKDYPLINKPALKNLKRLLSTLGNWCSFFNHVKFLPLFVFPFLKIFENDPIACFEALCTILINWCQHWFQYAPYPPINVLTMIENVLMQHDKELMTHFSSYNITGQLYAWTLLEVALSEICTIKEWCILWDHILSNEPSFLFMVVVAYNVINRSTLLSFETLEDFEIFYHSQNPINFKKLISKTYYLNENTTATCHPRQYLKDFRELEKGQYPVFTDYPKVAFDYETDIRDVDNEDKILKNLEEQMENKKKIEENALKEHLIQKEEHMRLQSLENFYREKMLEEKDHINKQRNHILKMKTDLHAKQAEILEISCKSEENSKLSEHKLQLCNLISDLKHTRVMDDYEIQKIEEEMGKYYIELLKRKLLVKEISSKQNFNKCDMNIEQKELQAERVKLRRDIERIQKEIMDPCRCSLSSVPVEEATHVNSMMHKYNKKVVKGTRQLKMPILKTQKTIKIGELEMNTKQLEKEVQTFLNRLMKIKEYENKNKSQLKKAGVKNKVKDTIKKQRTMTSSSCDC